MSINAAATKIAQKFKVNKAGHKGNTGNLEETVFVDPATVIMAGKIAIYLIKAFKKCKSGELQTTQRANNPGSLEKKNIQKAVRKHIGWFRWIRGEGKHLAKAVEDYGKEVSYQEVCELYEEDAGNDTDMVYRT